MRLKPVMSGMNLAGLARFLWAVSVLWLAACEPDVLVEQPRDDADRIKIDLPEDQTPPTFHFPGRVRTEDESLNKFIEQFKEVCLRGEYGQYRLKVSRRVEPLSKQQFENAWHAVKSVRIELIRKLEPGTVRKLSEAVGLSEPIYGLVFRTRLRETVRTRKADRQIVALIFKEEGQWVAAPAPRDIKDKLRRATTQPASTQPATSRPSRASR